MYAASVVTHVHSQRHTCIYRKCRRSYFRKIHFKTIVLCAEAMWSGCVKQPQANQSERMSNRRKIYNCCCYPTINQFLLYYSLQSSLSLSLSCYRSLSISVFDDASLHFPHWNACNRVVHNRWRSTVLQLFHAPRHANSIAIAKTLPSPLFATASCRHRSTQQQQLIRKSLTGSRAHNFAFCISAIMHSNHIYYYLACGYYEWYLASARSE